MTRPERLVCYFGHHKCASTWIHTVLSTFCDEAGLKCAYLANEGMFGGDLPGWVRAHDPDVLCYVNADWEHVEKLAAERDLIGIHMVRDPRDILASAYFSHLHSHKTGAWPELVEHRKRQQERSKDEGLLAEFDFNAEVFDEMHRWQYGQDWVLELRMEEFTPDPLNGWLAAFRHLDLIDETHRGKGAQLGWWLRSSLNIANAKHGFPLKASTARAPAERLLGMVHDNRFETKTAGRKEGEEDVTSHYRKGVAGDWRNHFTQQHVDEFKKRYGDLLVRLGYEDSADWGLEAPKAAPNGEPTPA